MPIAARHARCAIVNMVSRFISALGTLQAGLALSGALVAMAVVLVLPISEPLTPRILIAEPPPTREASEREYLRSVAAIQPIVGRRFADCEEAFESSKPHALIRFRVTREDGMPLANVMVEPSFLDDNLPTELTDADGRVAFQSRTDVKSSFVSVTRADFGMVTAAVRVGPDEVQIVVPTRSRVVGRVTVSGERSAPPRIELCGNAPVSSHFTTTLQTDGSFEFFNLPSNWGGTLRVPDYQRESYAMRDTRIRGPLTPMPPNDGAARLLEPVGDIDMGTFLSPDDDAASSNLGPAEVTIVTDWPPRRIEKEKPAEFEITSWSPGEEWVLNLGDIVVW
jgi:hypothetical protein